MGSNVWEERIPGALLFYTLGSNMMLAVQPRRILSRPKHLFALIFIAATIYWLLGHRSNTGYHVAGLQGGNGEPTVPALVVAPPGRDGEPAQTPLKDDTPTADSADGEDSTDQAKGDSDAYVPKKTKQHPESESEPEESTDPKTEKYQTAEEKELEEEHERAEKALRDEFEDEYKVLST